MPQLQRAFGLLIPRPRGLSAPAGIWHLRHLLRLKVLSLWNCLRVTAAGLHHICGLPITELSLRGCQVDESACQPLARLSTLAKLDFRACEKLAGKLSQDYQT